MPMYDYKCECGKVTEEFFKLEDYKARVKCECGKTAYRSFTMRQGEPSFTDKIYPYHDFALNKTLHSPSEKKAYLKKMGFSENPSKEFTTRKQEQRAYSMRLGYHDPKLRKYSN